MDEQKYIVTLENGEKEIKLPTPILIEDVEISSLVLRVPNTGNLRGLNLAAIGQLDFDACFTLLPRISRLNARDVLNLTPDNMTVLLTGMASFFVDIA